jgi:transcriptional regulator with GAF, ATPase, and Fis domain
VTTVETRERTLVETFALIADALVGDVEIGDLLTLLCMRCIELFPVDASGLLLREPDGKLGLAAASDERARLLEFLQLQTGEGACLEAASTGQPVFASDLHDEKDHWPAWAPAAVDAGFRGVTSIPLRLGGETLGSMNLFSADPGALSGDDLYAARALTQLATTALLAQRRLHDATTLAGQLQGALDSRVVIEQAKGVLAGREGIGLEEAFEVLRRQARAARRPLSEVAREVAADAR